MKNKSVLINLLLLIVFILLIVFGYFLVVEIKLKNKETEKEVVLRDIDYQSSVSPVGFKDAEGIITNFVNSYNEHNGNGVAQLMNLVATYIYSECENKDDFDKAYEEKLSAENSVDDIVIMQYSLQKQEKSLINGVDNTDVVLTLIENSEIEDKSKYLSTMTAKMRTVSEKDGIDEIDTLEFKLLHRDNRYYIIEYNLIESE